MNIQRALGLLSGPVAFATILLLPRLGGISPQAQQVLAVAALMLAWWLTEAVALPVTALLPMVLLPMMGVVTIDEATAPYSDSVVYLFFGGFILALALEKWNLHLRIALKIVQMTGTNANGIILGFMLATAFISMWISNTATTVMLLPIALSVVHLLKDQDLEMSKGMRNFALCLMLGVAYGANIGGIATLIGTPPNSVFAGFIKKTYGYEVSFGGWMLMAFPFSLLLLLLVYVINVYVLFPNGLGRFERASSIIREELAKLGRMSKAEKLVLLVFGGAAFLWIFRVWLNKQFVWLKLSDPAISVMAAIALFLIPVRWRDAKFLLDWKDTEKLPWGILLLFGGGLSLAGAMEKTGIIALIANYVASSSPQNLFTVAVMLGVVAVFMTEVMSNVALVTVLLPVVGGIAQGMGADPLLFTIPVTVGASCAFMLPMATPPNAIVFASGHIRVSQMARAGFWANLTSIVLITAMVWAISHWSSVLVG
jgi:sodium-dependent dicarboxylate transporter 2/3/5